jgi:hypothetical protein
VCNVPYQCDLCERSFIAKSQYLKHKAIHEGQSDEKEEENEPTTETTTTTINTGKVSISPKKTS